MTLKYLFTRFHKMQSYYIGKVSLITNLWQWFDFFLSALIYGTSISDYFAYGFYKLRPSARNEYITCRRFNKIQKIANNQSDIHLCRNKIDFNNHFSSMLGRQWIDTKSAPREEILQFIKKHPIFFKKDVLGLRGDGVKRIDSTNIDISVFCDNLQNQKDVHYILEEPLTEIKALQDYHPWSVNTLRIVTLYDSKQDIVHFMNARIRIGNKQNNVDNFHYDGIGANIDIHTGIICSLGYDMYNNTYISHPITNQQILGFQIPKWEQCLEFINVAVRKLPTIRYVGWDLVIAADGSFCLIEANDNADHDFQQLHNQGLWKEYKQLLNEIK